MSEETRNTDELLRRSLTEAIGPSPLSDEDIQRLPEASIVSPADELRLAGIARKARQLIADDFRSAGGRLAGFNDPSNDKTRKAEVRMEAMKDPCPGGPRSRNPRGAVAALLVSAMALVAVLVLTSRESLETKQALAQHQAQERDHLRSLQRQWMTARFVPEVTTRRVQVGDIIQTGQRERRRVGLPDGSVLYVNESTRAQIKSPRRVEVARGEVYVEVVPSFGDGQYRDKFQIVTPTRTVTALGTRFGVDTTKDDADVVVTQGKVRVSNVDDTLQAGQRLTVSRNAKEAARNDGNSVSVRAAMRASEHLSWTRDLMNAAAGAIIPASRYAGGAIISVDPNGQEMKLSLRKYHVDVHIEDGFARTTIDQTYFNHTQSRLEGTFHFPLPADASLSRLAMYVNGKLMEGGMAERQHARNTFEQIVHKMQDPALLEWVDGSTFKMRVFPLEARQEKRIVLSYTQRLNTAYGKTYYRFPAGHSMDVVREWSTTVRVANGEKESWNSPSHKLTVKTENGDLLLTGTEKQSRMNRDLVVELGTSDADNFDARTERARWSQVSHEGNRYLMLRYRPDLAGNGTRNPRHWVFLFEASADRNSILARTQIEIIRTLLENAEHGDTFNIVTSGTESTVFSRRALKCTAKNTRRAMDHLNQTHLIGALNLQKAFRTCADLADDTRETLIVHTGSAIPVLGSHDRSELLGLLPETAAYVGVGVGRNWSRPFMKEAASRSGGYFTQINPDEEVAWRAFELSSLLNTPRLLSVAVTCEASRPTGRDIGERLRDGAFLNFADTIAQGEEICAVTRLNDGQKLPKAATIHGMLNGRPWQKTIRIRRVADGADYLPRSWARLQIDQLVADSANEHKSEIIRLSKSMYVMSPFTSLLVLENEQMYTQYNIDRGRSDHWALYDCPQQIKVVHEPLVRSRNVAATAAESKPVHWLSTIRILPVPQLISDSGFVVPASGNTTTDAIRPDAATHWHRQIYLNGVETANALQLGETYLSRNHPLTSHDDALQFIFPDESFFDQTIVAPVRVFDFDMGRINGRMNLRPDLLQRQRVLNFESDMMGTRSTSIQTMRGRSSRRVRTVDEFRTELALGLQDQQQAVQLLSRNNRTREERLIDPGVIIVHGNHADIARVQQTIAELEALQPAAPEATDLSMSLAKSQVALQQQIADLELRNAELFAPITIVNQPHDSFRSLSAGLAVQQSAGRTSGVNDAPTPAVVPSFEFGPVGREAWNFPVDSMSRYSISGVDSSGFDYGAMLQQPTLSFQRAAGAMQDGNFGTVIDSDGGIAGPQHANGSSSYQMLSGGGFGGDMGGTAAGGRGGQLGVLDQSGVGGGAGGGTRFRQPPTSAGRYLLAPQNGSSSIQPLTATTRQYIAPLPVQEFEMAYRMMGVQPEQLGWSEYPLDWTDGAWAWPASANEAMREQQVAEQEALIRKFRAPISERELEERRRSRQSEPQKREPSQSSIAHRWGRVAPPVGDQPTVRLPTFGYHVPAQFGNDRRWFGDLMSHAPGLNTWRADILAIAEEQSPQKRKDEWQQGTIEHNARRLITKARTAGWEKITWPAADDRSSFEIVCDGQGRHVFRRTVSEGLTEEVICDGETLTHAYAEIGLASKRAFTRFHRRTIESLVPWLLPRVEELARHADILTVDENTVAVVPRLPDSVKSDLVAKASGKKQESKQENKAPEKKSAVAKPVIVETHLIFDNSGRLVERKLVLSGSGKVLLRTVFEDDGSVRIVDGEDKLLVTLSIERKPAEAPDLKPDHSHLVTLPMPVRSSEQVLGDRGSEEIADMSEEELLALVLADTAEGNGQRAVNTIETHFLNRNDRREGFFLLLSRFPHLLRRVTDVSGTEGRKREIDLRPSADGSPLMQFVRQYISWQLDKQQGPPNFDLEDHGSGFVHRMATACNTYHRWSSGAAVNDRTKNQIKKDLARSLKFISTCRTDAMGWTLISAIEPKIKAKELSGLYAEAVKRFEDSPVLGWLAREARVSALFRAEKRAEARRLYREYILASVTAGTLPRISPDLRTAFLADNGDNEWGRLMSQVAAKLKEAKQQRAMFMFSVQLRQLGDTKQADQLLQDLVAKLDHEHRPDIVLLAAEQYRQLSDGRAVELLDSLTEIRPLQQSPAFWRYAASVADSLGKKQAALRHLERAVQLEFDKRPEVVNIQRVRADYADLFRRFEEIIDASSTLEVDLPKDLFARIIRSADQWRALEDDPTTCCQTAARLLTKLNRTALAWSYLTTPLAGRSGESKPWQQLAEQLAAQKQIDLADTAWTTAFEFEQTNPEILYGHAMMLRNNGRAAESRMLLKRIVDSNWQPRFNRTQNKARTQLAQ